MAIKRAQIAAVKEPISLLQQDGKRPDGTILIPWACGNMTWDVTVPDTFAESHLGNTAREPGAAANKASAAKISNMVHCPPLTLQTPGEQQPEPPEAWIHGCRTLTVTKNGPDLLLKVFMFNMQEI